MQILCFGDPVTDALAHLSHEHLGTITSEPGGCFSVGPDEMAKLLAAVSKQCQIKM